MKPQPGVISESLWRRRFENHESVIGCDLRTGCAVRGSNTVGTLPAGGGAVSTARPGVRHVRAALAAPVHGCSGTSAVGEVDPDATGVRAQDPRASVVGSQADRLAAPFAGQRRVHRLVRPPETVIETGLDGVRGRLCAAGDAHPCASGLGLVCALRSRVGYKVHRDGHLGTRDGCAATHAGKASEHSPAATSPHIALTARRCRPGHPR